MGFSWDEICEPATFSIFREDIFPLEKRGHGLVSWSRGEKTDTAFSLENVEEEEKDDKNVHVEIQQRQYTNWNAEAMLMFDNCFMLV